MTHGSEETKKASTEKEKPMENCPRYSYEEYFMKYWTKKALEKEG